MMIRSNGRYFDFNGDIEMERRVKLFEEIDETLGDFSYEFELPWTSNNFAIFGYPLPDSVKAIYKSVHAEILDNDGLPVYIGQIRLDRYVPNTVIYCSFFSGNYNWVGLLSGFINEIDFSDLDTDLSEAEIINNGVNTEGIFFPLIDTGGLVTRGGRNLVLKDFTGMMFVKTAFKRILQDAGIKLTGDIITDPIFNSALVSRLTVDQKSIDDRSSYIGKGADQVITGGGSPFLTKITFVDETTPFFDGEENNFASSTYTADVKMEVKIEAFFRFAETSAYNPANDQIIRFRIYINGIEVFHVSEGIAPFPVRVSVVYSTTLEAGDYVELFAFIDSFPDVIDTTIYADSWVKITPKFIFKTFGNSLLPNWTKAEFVNSVLSLFCCICDYDPVSKFLTVDYFNGIKTKDPIDISEFIYVHTVDTSEFISSFGKKSLLKYQDSDFDAIKEYNVKFTEPYGSGVINVDNDFIPNTVTILESDFKAPVSYINPIFSASLERVNFVEMETLDSADFTSIQDSGAGTARINMADASAFTRLDLCRIKDCNEPEYKGDWLITSVSSTFIVIDRPFTVTAVGTVTKIDHRYTNTEDVHIFIAVTYDDDNVSRFSNNSDYKIVENLYSNISYSFFNLLNIGVAINDEYRQSLAFGVVRNNLSYQRNLLQTYWPNVDNILNDPVKLLADAGIPKSVFMAMTPLRPLRVRTSETDNLYYQNRILGYKDSYTRCHIELIKLS